MTTITETREQLEARFETRVASIVSSRYPKSAKRINAIRICAQEYSSCAKIEKPDVFERRAQLAANDVPMYN